MPAKDSRPCILVLGYNRPRQLSQTLLALREARQFSGYRLLVVVDGKSEEVRKVVESAISPEILIHTDPPKDFVARQRIHYNLRIGLNLAFSEGRSPYCIVLEDDIVVSKDFLRFVDQLMLERIVDPLFRAINGFGSVGGSVTGDGSDYVRGNYGVGWGWALPQRTYRKIKPILAREGDFHWDRLVEPVMRTGYVINPVRSQILNMGLDGSGSHTSSPDDALLGETLARSFHNRKERIEEYSQSVSGFKWRDDYVVLDALGKPLRLLTYLAGYCLQALSSAQYRLSVHNARLLVDVEVSLRRLITKKVLPTLGRRSQRNALAE